MGWCAKPRKASETAKAKGSHKPVNQPVQPCPKEEANIVYIAWLDGADDKEVASATQWVNLPRADKWVNGVEVKNKDRLGLKPRIKVRFDRPGAHPFTVKLLAPTGTDPYTDTEKGRNGNFSYTGLERNYTTQPDGTRIIDGDFSLVAGGGYSFKAWAKDKQGKVVQTGDLTTKRLFWFVEAKMAGLTSVLASTAPVEAEYANHHMVLKKHAALNIARQHNIGTAADNSTLSTNVNNAVDAQDTIKATKPYLLTVAYTDHLAVKHADVLVSKAAVEVGPGKPKVTIPVTAAGLLPPNTVATRYLWHDIVPGEGWFVEAKFHPDGGGAASAIAANKVTPKGSGNYWHQVEVDVTALPAGQGRLDVKVNVVDRMRGGLALGGANQTCVCTRAWWADVADAEQSCTIIHELGHKVGMVADGTGKLPDRVATQYSDSGHAGSHCHAGCAAGQANYATAANGAASTCVLFGAVNSKQAFCADCGKAVKKLDIGSGW